MISVLLTILKVVGILLLVLFGILLLLIGLMLFVPIRYFVEGSIDPKICAKGRISFLLSLLRYEFTFEEGEFEGRLRICGIRLRSKKKVSEEELEEDVSQETEELENNLADSEEKLVDTEEILTDSEKNLADTVENQTDTEKKLTDIEEKLTDTEENCVNNDTAKNIRKEDKENTTDKENAGNEESAENENSIKYANKNGQTEAIKEKKSLKNFWKKLQAAWKKFLEKGKNIKESAEKLQALLANEDNQHAVKKLLAELKYLLKHFGFRKINTDLTFSLADPALTGQALGVLCMMPFLYQYEFHIYPDFESESYYLRGSFAVKGRVRLVHVVVTLVRLWKDKIVRSFLKKLLDADRKNISSVELQE